MRRLYLFLVSLTLMAALFAVVPFGVAFASGGPGHYAGPNKYKGGIAPKTTCASAPSEQNCTGQDPIAQGCQADAYTVPGGTVDVYNDRRFLLGYVELRYSKACQSNWARTVVAGGRVDYLVTATVTRRTDGKSFSYTYTKGDISSVYTNMVYAPGTVQAMACGGMEGYYGYNCTPWI